ncbi:MAG: hypothetical protein U5K72_04915 [Balneolaceae bacterium]|nr:hypothetical protein [Balneolaceae bacterium]
MVKGSAIVDLKDKANNFIESNNFKLKGSFKDKDHVFLEYKNQDKNKTDYGSLLMFLQGNGNRCMYILWDEVAWKETWRWWPSN